MPLPTVMKFLYGCKFATLNPQKKRYARGGGNPCITGLQVAPRLRGGDGKRPLIDFEIGYSHIPPPMMLYMSSVNTMHVTTT